jgi:hypothetical protein
MSYWDDLERFNRNEHKRDMEYLKKQHEYTMKELQSEVELFTLKAKINHDTE